MKANIFPIVLIFCIYEKMKKNFQMISKLNLLVASKNILPSKCLRFESSNSIPPRVLSLFNGLVQNKRADLARSITLIETSNQQKKKEAQIILNMVLANLKEKRKDNSKHSLRIGFTGPPGAGN